MRKTRLVVFTTNNARLLNQPNNREIKTYPNAVLNPDLSLVKGVPPHFWKRDGNRIIPMTDAEQQMRRIDIEKNGTDNEIRRLSNWRVSPHFVLSAIKHASTFMFFAGSVLFTYAVIANYFPKIVAWMTP